MQSWWYLQRLLAPLCLVIKTQYSHLHIWPMFINCLRLLGPMHRHWQSHCKGFYSQRCWRHWWFTNLWCSRLKSVLLKKIPDPSWPNLSHPLWFYLSHGFCHSVSCDTKLSETKSTFSVPLSLGSSLYPEFLLSSQLPVPLLSFQYPDTFSQALLLPWASSSQAGFNTHFYASFRITV